MSENEEKPNKSKMLRIGAVRPAVDSKSEEMLIKLANHYDRNLSDTVRHLIRNEYEKVFGGGKKK